MFRLVRRAVLVAALPLALAGTAVPAAHATGVTVPGCFGVSTEVVCDPSVEFVLPLDVTTYTTTIPVCAGSCYDVPVTLVQANQVSGAHVCVSYENRNGTPTAFCEPLTSPSVVSCGSPQLGYRVYGGDGTQLLDACFDRPDTPSYQARKCSSPYSGYYVYDRNTGDTVLDLCFSTQA